MMKALRIVPALLAVLSLTSASAQWTGFVHPGYNSIYSVTTDATGIYMVGYPNGIAKSTNGGGTWNAANTGFSNVGNVVSVYYTGGSLLAGTYNGIYRSTNNGATWTLSNTGMPTVSATNYPKKFFKFGSTVFAVMSANIGGSGSGGVWRSTDDGLTWFSGNGGLSSNMTVYQLAQMNGLVWAATSAGLTYTSNLGVNWSTDAASNFSCFAIQGTNSRMVVVSSFGYRYRNYNSGNGTWGTWTNATSGAPASPTGGELILYDGKYWSITGGSPSTVIRSTDNGVTYSAYTTGLGGADVITQYAFHAGGTTLYLGALFSLYGHPGTTTGVDAETTGIELPRPFPTVFTDGFQVDLGAQPARSDLVLMDASGREVAVHRDLSPGLVRFERGDLPAGTYRLFLSNTAVGLRSSLGAVIAQ